MFKMVMFLFSMFSVHTNCEHTHRQRKKSHNSIEFLNSCSFSFYLIIFVRFVIIIQFDLFLLLEKSINSLDRSSIRCKSVVCRQTK